jgi:hypothetical protein
MLTEVINCRWGKASGALAEGALLHNGDELNLIQGRALVTFSSGARVVIEGPARLTTRSEMSAGLAAGALTANVPRQATGFAIYTPLAHLVDLGTEFTAKVHPDDSLELHVFSGLVELQLIHNDRPVDDAPLRVSEGVAVKVDSKSRIVDTLPYDATQRMSTP